MNFEQSKNQETENIDDIVEELKMTLEKKQKMLNSLREAEQLPMQEQTELAEVIESSQKETKKEIADSDEESKILFDKAVMLLQNNPSHTEELQKITTRFLRAADPSEALAAVAMLEELFLYKQKLAA